MLSMSFLVRALCCIDDLLRDCRLRRRFCDPDDVIVGVVGTLTSRGTAYSSLPRDLPAGARTRRRAGSDSPVRRNGRNRSSLVRVDSGLADDDDSVGASASSPPFIDDVCHQLTVPPAPAVSLQDCLRPARPNFAMNKYTAGFDSNDYVSYAADARETGKTANGELEKGIRTNRKLSSSGKKKRKKKVRKTKTELISPQANESVTREEAERSRGDDKQGLNGASEPVWELNGVKLWRFCEQVLAGSGATDAEPAADKAAVSRPSEALQQPGTSAVGRLDSLHAFGRIGLSSMKL